MPGRAVCPARGPGGRWTPWHAKRPSGASDGANEVGRTDQLPADGRLRSRVGCWSACGWGSGMPSTVRPDPSTLGVVGERGSRRESCSQLVSGWLFGLLQNPRDVVGAAVDDRNRDDARYLVGVLPLGAIHDSRKEATAGAQGDSALSLVVDLALPAVGGADGRKVVARGTADRRLAAG